MNLESLGYSISTDRDKLNIPMIHQFLATSYWAKNIPLETVKEAINNSLCFGVYFQNQQIAFARIITDSATFAYLADVFVVEHFRNKGVSKFLMQYISNYEKLQGLRRWMLATRDAHSLYLKFGFSPLAMPARFMEKHSPEIYQLQN